MSFCLDWFQNLILSNLIKLLVLLWALFGLQATQAQFSGQVLNYNGVRLDQPDQLFVGRTSIRSNLTKQWDRFKLHGSFDLQHPYGSQFDTLDVNVRELYVDLYLDRLDVRLGQQSIARGRAYGSILTDNVSPLDLSEFLTRDLTELRRGLPAIVARLSVGSHQLEGMVNPIPVKTRLPNRGSSWDFFNQTDWPIPVSYLEDDLPVQFSSVQWGLQFMWRPSVAVSLDLGAQLWRYPLPAYKKELRMDPRGMRLELSEHYQRTPVFTASGDMVLKDGFVLVGELVHYNSRWLDKKTPDLARLPAAFFQGTLPPDQAALIVQGLQDPDGYLVQKPFSIGMLGAEYTSGSTFLSLQTSSEWVWKHTTQVALPQWNPSASFLLRNEWLQGTWSVRALSRIGLQEGDYWVHPELQWKPKDPVQIALGSHLFGGSKNATPTVFSFSQYKANSFIYLRLAHQW